MSGRSALGVTHTGEAPSSPRTELVLLSEPPHDSSPPSSVGLSASSSGVRRSPIARTGEPRDDDDRALREAIGKNLHRLRSDRALSYEKLARASGVSRAMLNQIELGQSAPTTTLLLKIARALRVTIAALLQSDDSPVLHVERRTTARTTVTGDGGYSSRLLSRPYVGGPKFEEIRLRSQGQVRLAPAEPGARKGLTVTRGQLRLTLEDVTHRLEPGDSVELAADHPLTLENHGTEDVSAYVITYSHRK